MYNITIFGRPYGSVLRSVLCAFSLHLFYSNEITMERGVNDRHTLLFNWIEE